MFKAINRTVNSTPNLSFFKFIQFDQNVALCYTSVQKSENSVSYDGHFMVSSNNYFKADGDYGLRFIHGDGGVDSIDWAVIDFGPLKNTDFDGNADKTKGRFFGGETTSGGSGGMYNRVNNGTTRDF